MLSHVTKINDSPSARGLRVPGTAKLPSLRTRKKTLFSPEILSSEGVWPNLRTSKLPPDSNISNSSSSFFPKRPKGVLERKSIYFLPLFFPPKTF
jgi:hypothetical protein